MEIERFKWCWDYIEEMRKEVWNGGYGERNTTVGFGSRKWYKSKLETNGLEDGVKKNGQNRRKPERKVLIAMQWGNDGIATKTYLWDWIQDCLVFTGITGIISIC